MPSIITRPIPFDSHAQLLAQGMSPLLARLYAARGIQNENELACSLDTLLPFEQLKNSEAMADRLADAIARRERLVVVADYDCDGATACAVAIKGLTALGGVVDFIVPDRFRYGYGLTPEIVELASSLSPDIIMTVDNGIASVAGVEAAQARGIDVLITDHHLPGERLPNALIVNPNQPGCTFPSKHLAGVGVIFYVLMALRSVMRQRGAFLQRTEPNLAALLDYVALGTVADVVVLDQNNRTLVENGLRRIRAGRLSAGMTALFQVAGRLPDKASTFDLGFTIGPRLNAAGRLDDMSIGISCLLADTLDQALPLAQQLDSLNRERRHIETSMQEDALHTMSMLDPKEQYTLSLYRDDWHQGVVGIVASRLKERFHRPTMVFAPGDSGEIKGSGRSIAGFHLRDAVDLVSKRYPGLVLKFGGHAMAAGLTLVEAGFDTFCEAFEQVARELLPIGQLTRTIETDGALSVQELHIDLAEAIRTRVWGQGFPAPTFHDVFYVTHQRIVAQKHLKLQLEKEGQRFDAMLFNQNDWLPEVIEAVYQLAINEWQGRKELQIHIEYCVTASR